MEKERGSKIIAIIALLIAVVGLSLGFAAFTKDLNITFTESNVNVSGELDIKFLASEDPEDTSTTVNALVLYGATSGNPATISTDGLTVSGIGATFNDKGQEVGYNLYIYNNSEYDAYLKSVDFLNYTGAETYKVCTALEGTTQSLVDAACEDVHVGMVLTSYNGFETEIYDTSVTSTSLKIPKGEMLSVYIFIAYVDEGMAEYIPGGDGTSLLPNGDFKIDFGEVKFNFSSLEG